jgi:hypothetical protein
VECVRGAPPGETSLVGPSAVRTFFGRRLRGQEVGCSGANEFLAVTCSVKYDLLRGRDFPGEYRIQDRLERTKQRYGSDYAVAWDILSPALECVRLRFLKTK